MQGRKGRKAVGETGKQAGKRQLCSLRKQAGKRQLCSGSSRRKEEKEEKQSARLENMPKNVNSVAQAVGAKKGKKRSSRRG